MEVVLSILMMRYPLPYPDCIYTSFRQTVVIRDMRYWLSGTTKVRDLGVSIVPCAIMVERRSGRRSSFKGVRQKGSIRRYMQQAIVVYYMFDSVVIEDIELAKEAVEREE